MDFSKLRHRIVFLKPLTSEINILGENVPVWIPFKASTNNDIRINDQAEVYLTKNRLGNAELVFKNGEAYARKVTERDFQVWAYVAPRTGREYDEAQKIRAATTYTVITRYFEGITADMQIKFGNHLLKIESVLNIDERNEQLQIVASEVDRFGKEG